VTSFASDNYSGVHPAVLEAIAAANVGRQPAYGRDDVTARLQTVVRDHFGDRASAYPVFNGTGANVVALQAMTTRWAAVVCTSTAHIHVDECGAPEKVGGVKLLTIPTFDGKLTPELVDLEARGMDDVHRAQPQVVSITQTTELGTAYTVEEIRAICDHAHALGLRVHLDGARIANAAAHLGVSLREMTTDAGVDVVSFGGTKNGLMLGEAVVVLDPAAAPHLDYVRKASTQLASKMRFVSAQLEVLLGTDLWIENAAHANAMAQRLASGLDGLVELPRAVQANAVFARLPRTSIDALQETYEFYVWDESVDEVRWMTAWDTTPEDVDTFVTDVRRALVASATTAGR
jgi:threonine aldolase